MSALVQNQVVLEPETNLDASSRWRWNYQPDDTLITSAWFATRDEAIDDATALYPGIGIG